MIGGKKVVIIKIGFVLRVFLILKVEFVLRMIFK